MFAGKDCKLSRTACIQYSNLGLISTLFVKVFSAESALQIISDILWGCNIPKT